jgi:hypothetical protein
MWRATLLLLSGCVPGMLPYEAPPTLGDGGPPPTQLQLDDEASANPTYIDVRHSPAWTVTSATPGHWGTNYRYRSTSTADHDPVSWWFRLPQPMQLEVSAWWTEGSNRSEDAGFYALDAQLGLIGTARVDQTTAGSRWNRLGVFDFPAGWNRVALSRLTGTGDVVIADGLQLRIPGAVDLVDALLALTQSCAVMPGTTPFRTDAGTSPTIPICEVDGAVWWRADLDIDCDGGTSAACLADPYYLPGTAAVDSQGDYLDASTLPFVVLPLASNGFDFRAQGLELGSVVAVIHNGQLVFGVIGDLGPRGVIGETSAAMADLLGISSDPVVGGYSGTDVTYIAFQGPAGDVDPIEDFGLAQQVGESVAWQVVAAN